MSQTQFDQQFELSFNYANSLFLSRQLPLDYSWLLNNQQGLVPDYFTIQTMGRNIFERFLNRSTGLFFGSYSISFKVIQRFVDLFYMIVRHDESKSKDWLLKRLRKPPKVIAKWTLVEFFLFMDHWLRGVCGIKFMTFESTKTELNLQALDLIESVKHKLEDYTLQDLLYICCYSNWLDVVVPDFLQRKDMVFETLRNKLNLDFVTANEYKISDLVNANQFYMSAIILGR